MFAKVEATDDDDVATMDEHTVKSLGTIRLAIRRARNVREYTTTCTYLGVPEEPKVILHEKAKKGASHQAARVSVFSLLAEKECTAE